MPKKTRYIISTVAGEVPSNIIFGEVKASTWLQKCQKGWPEKEWALFRISYDNFYLLELNGNSKVPEVIREHVKAVLGIKEVEAGNGKR